MSDFILFPSDTPLPHAAGGKARALDRLARAGFNPPEFFVLLPSAFDETGLIETHAQALTNALETLGPGPFAVRSSGAQEDGAEHSHAGQFLSLLNVAASDVKTAAHEVWASGKAGSVADYRDARGLDAVDPAPAIVVQAMVAADSAGVAFSADPVSGLRHHAVVSAIEGLGDQLVSGAEDGETWLIDTLQTTILSASDGEPVLSTTQALDVADLAVRIEQAFGAPQDIEWAYHEKVLHILQARPITTPLKAPAQDDDQLLVFDNSNIVESYPGLVSPLTYSFAQYAYARVYRAFVRMVGVREDAILDNAPVFENMLARVDGRVYYNLGNWYRALALLPGFAINRSHMETMMGVSEPLPDELTASIGPGELTGLDRWREYGRMARAGLGLLGQALRLKTTIQDFYNRLNDAIGPGSLDPEAANLTDLALEYRRIEASLLDRWDAPIVNDFLCMMAFGASRKMMERWFGQAGLDLHNQVMIGQGDIISAEPAQRIAEMGKMVRAHDGLADQLRTQGQSAMGAHPELRQAFDGYLEKFGERCTQELKLESITLDEDPSSLVAAIAAAASRPSGSNTSASAPTAGFATVANGKPIRGFVARRLVNWAKARVRDRENLRFERTRIFGRARRVFLAMGRELTALGHLDDPRDVLHLTVNELLGAIEGFTPTQNLRGLVKLRQAEMTDSANRPDPPERLTVRGAAINVGIGNEMAAPVSAEEDAATSRTGTACSAGTVTAKARVIDDPSTQSLDHGDILVARHTDPGWIAVFANASAIVVERGSLLSHSAIVAREMGIPCVVALKNATHWINDGETITVNGATGEVVRSAS
ncbi:MAG: PEP/pyruvate-binding domain-containing protein [Hyphomicrobiales bacterium]